MIIHFKLLIILVFTIELLGFLKIHLLTKLMLSEYKKIFILLIDKKNKNYLLERKILESARHLLKVCFKILLIFIVITFIFYIINIIDAKLIIFLISIKGIIECIVISIAYFLLRNYINEKK